MVIVIVCMDGPSSNPWYEENKILKSVMKSLKMHNIKSEMLSIAMTIKQATTSNLLSSNLQPMIEPESFESSATL